MASIHRYQQQRFTLMEVMIASIILALAATASLAIIGGASSSILQAETRWGDQHAATSAVEYYLLLGAEAPVPTHLLPPGYTTQCQLLEVDDLHDEATTAIQNWKLGEFQIMLYNARGELVNETRVRKLVKEDDLP